MRRGMYDNEYAKVRARADLKADMREAIRRDTSDEKGFDPKVGEHLKQLADSMVAKDAAEAAKRAAEIKGRMDAHTMKSNRIAALREWLSIGCKPPHVDADGWPTVTLSFYLSIGWTIRDDGPDGKSLVPPPPEPDPRLRETLPCEMGS